MAKWKTTSVNTGAGASGDGINFKQATLAAAAAHLLEPLEGILKENHVTGNKRDWQSCKNKWIMCKKKHTAITDIKSQSGFSWDEELGTNIGPADAVWWTAFMNACPDMKPFHNKGWKHFDDMDDLLHAQIMRGTNAFHAGQETLNHNKLLTISAMKENQELKKMTRVGWLQEESGMKMKKISFLGKQLLLPPPPPPPTKRKSTAASLTPSLTGSCLSGPPSKCQHSKKSAIALFPQRKQAAMQCAQLLKTHLNDDSMAVLIEAFQMDVSAADMYMVMSNEGPRKSFVDRKIKFINKQSL
ncbi:hypothetical protein EDB19DRAFT_1974551 [Suillus lakei]|nr:hypothetical protein EDB19DRAFT_1974551 [Suillus lakei]